jgi:hypothetical protein
MLFAISLWTAPETWVTIPIDHMLLRFVRKSEKQAPARARQRLGWTRGPETGLGENNGDLPEADFWPALLKVRPWA